MSHKCDVRQCDSTHCNTTSDRLDSRFLRTREGHPATAPPIPSSTSDHSGLAWITAPISISGCLVPFSFSSLLQRGSSYAEWFERFSQETLVGQLAVLWCRTIEPSFIPCFFWLELLLSGALTCVQSVWGQEWSPPPCESCWWCSPGARPATASTSLIHTPLHCNLTS